MRSFPLLRLLALALPLCLGPNFHARAQEPPPSTAATSPEEDDSIQLQFPNNGVADILGIYELLTGLPVIKDSRIFEGEPISLVTAKPITRQEAIELIESSLQINGYVVTRAADGKSVRVTMQRAPQASVTRGLKIHRNPEELPPGSSTASYFLQLEHLDPQEAATAIWSHLGLNRFGRLTPVASPPGLLITESADNIRQILRVAEVLDVPRGLSRLRTEFYTLKYADAVVIGQILTSTFTTRQTLPPITSDTTGDDETRPPVRMVKNVPARVVADDRLNRVMLVALEEDHEYAKRIIMEFDQPMKDLTPLERRLKYVFVDQVLPVLVDILQDTGTGTSTMAGGEVVRTRRPPQASSDPATLAGRPRRSQTQREATTSPPGYEDQLAPPEDNSAPLSVLVGKTRLVADVQSNKLLAYGPTEDLARVSGLLDRLDKKPPQVYLATIIGQLSLDDTTEFGVSYLRQLERVGDDFSVAGGLLNWNGLPGRVADVRNPIIDPSLPPLDGLNLYGQIKDNLDVFVNALEATQRFKVLSRPSIYAANNKKAVITSGRRIPVPTSSFSDLSNTDSVRTNIAFQDVVLKLEVIPLINSNREVSLTIAQVNDTVVGQQQVAENNVPIIGTERLLTSVTVANRSTIVLGGLISEDEEKVASGVPVLGRIPVLGHAFKTTKSTKRRKELLIFIQPVVVEDDEETAAISLEEDRRTAVGADAAEIFPQVPPQEPERAAAPPLEVKTTQPPRGVNFKATRRPVSKAGSSSSKSR